MILINLQKFNCNCGCGQEVLPSSPYYIPKFVKGHKDLFRKSNLCTTLNKSLEKYCKCGCGEKIKIKKYRIASKTIPDYITGHKLKEHFNSGKASYNKGLFKYEDPGIGTFVECACGCGNRKEIQPHHRYRDKTKPFFIHGHNTERSVENSRDAIPFCQCGCGKKVKYKRIKPFAKYLAGHNPLTEETIAKKAENRKNWDDSKKKATFEKMSKSRIDFILRNEGNTSGFSYIKRGVYSSVKNQKDLKYDSGMELAAYELLEHLPHVESFDRCPFVISYEFDKKRRYLPDILVIYEDGTKQVIEVKPLYMVKDAQVQAKKLAGEKYCRDNNLIYSTWTEKEIPNYNKKVKRDICVF